MTDSDSDSDYAPENDKDMECEAQSQAHIAAIPASRKRKANDLFAELVASDTGSVKAKMETVFRSGAMSKKVGSANQPTRKRKNKDKKLQEMMKQIFGSGSEAARPAENAIEQDDIDIRSMARKSVQNLKKDTTIVETKKFAGKTVQIERKLKAGNDPVAGATDKGKKAESSLDKVLVELKGPQVVSTVSKSSADWDGYKDKEGLEEELAVATKEGYLTRKDFLERCDVRQFENERDERQLNASKK